MTAPARMRKNSIDTVIRLRLRHQPGQLARFASLVAQHGAMLGDIVTVAIGEEHTVRDVTVETEDQEGAAAVLAAARAAFDVLQSRARVFDAHRGGKIQVTGRAPVEQIRDLRTIYTPGVARVVEAIRGAPALAWDYTALGSCVGIFTNGSRVLGLGDVGPLASLPVMEGKALLYHRLAGLSAVPVLVDTDDAIELTRVIERCSVGFGAIHLEDIRSPDCFQVEALLAAKLRKPVMHDDQHGTATAALAALLNACRITGKAERDVSVGQIGLGAAGTAIARLLLAFGVRRLLVHDPSGEAVARLAGTAAQPVELAALMAGSDVVIATTGHPGLIAPAMIRRGQVIFALSNPRPEIEPELAIQAGAAHASDGRAINNALVFPGLMRGALRARSACLTASMFTAAAAEIARLAPRGELLPSVLDPDVHDAVTLATVTEAKRAGLAGTAAPGDDAG